MGKGSRLKPERLAESFGTFALRLVCHNLKCRRLGLQDDLNTQTFQSMSSAEMSRRLTLYCGTRELPVCIQKILSTMSWICRIGYSATSDIKESSVRQGVKKLDNPHAPYSNETES